ncbi:hypothetical protein V2J09_014942 [Rumex salicifolius]
MLGEEALVPAGRPPSRALQQRIFSFLETCDSVSKLRQIHGQLITQGCSQKRFLLSKIISLYTTFGSFRRARRAFDVLATPNTTAWNQMIRLSSVHGEPSAESVQLLNRMRNQGSKPDEYSYSYSLSACVQFGMLWEGKQIHGRVVSDGYTSNVVIGTSLVNVYASCCGESGDDFLYARKVFDELPDRNVVTWNSLLAGYLTREDFDGAMRVFDEMPQRSIVSWTTMVSGCARHGHCSQALSYFNEMHKADVKLDEAALIAALSACAELGDLDLGRWIHSYIHKTFQCRKTDPFISLQNTLMHMYISCGVLNEAFRVFKEIPYKSVVSWTSMIVGYAKHGLAEKALILFQLMKANKVKPDAITFIGVLCACSHAGLVEEGGEYFKEMKDRWGIEPRIEHYGCMVDLLSRAGLLDEAMKLIQSMPMVPNNSIWGALLCGCRIHKNAKVAGYAANNLMVERNPHKAMGYMLLLSDMYEMGGKWKDIDAIRVKMIHKIGVPKNLGRSWIQANGIMHDFARGD